MLNRTQLKLFLMRLLGATVGLTALLLLALLATASANTEFFDRYYSWLYAANVAVALIFMLIVGGLVVMIIARVRARRFGTKLLAKLAIFFALVGVLPGGIIYLVSLQFVSRSIESWFDVNVETALTSGLSLGQGVLDNSLNDLRNKARVMADQIGAGGSANSSLTLSRLREQFGVEDAMIVTLPGASLGQASGRGLSLVPSSRVRVMAEASAMTSPFSNLLPHDLPTEQQLAAVGERGYDASTEGELDGDGGAGSAQGALRQRVIVRIPSGYDATALQPDERFLQITQPVSPALARSAEAVQRAYKDYQEKSLGRTGLRKMYIGTLTLALFLATFIAMMLALVLGNQLARPLFLLAQGTMEVARGDYTPKGEIKSNDELGFLTKSFNAMTRQLAEARAAVEGNRVALENSKAYLESVLANLTAGVFVFDRQFRLTTANPGAERIFRQPFESHLTMPLDQIAVLAEFGTLVKKAFADRDAANRLGRGDRGHWQRQIEVPVAGETEPLTLLVRGTRLLRTSKVGGGASGEEVQEDVSLAGYVVVFDDISDVISAQRSIAWGEVARRLAHEIKNPLTPIQLSAERLQMKLVDKLGPAEAEFLKRGATTIVNQVAAMKRMVDDFRDYARTPPAMLQNLQLNELIAEVLTLYGIDEGRGPIRVELGTLPIIKGDPTQLRQVIHNLLQNAQDAVADRPDARVLLETRTVEYGDPDAQGRTPLAVRMTVSDNGAGFPARILTRAFEPYVTTKAKGTGLGLATVKKIVDEHGARIDIRNQDMTGSEGGGAQISILFLQLAQEVVPPTDVTEHAKAQTGAQTKVA